MAIANIEIRDFGNFVLHNLMELAKFEGLIDIRDNFGSKLNIDTDGRFVLVNGWKAAAKRTTASSLTNEYNRKTVENLLKNAINKLFTDGIQRNPGLRKAIFDGIRGYKWLLGSYGLIKSQSMKNLSQIQKDFTLDLKAAINKMDRFHLCFGTTQPEMRMENLGQSVYMDDDFLMDKGICAGITTKWLVRWVTTSKASMLDSSKALSQQHAAFNHNLDMAFVDYKNLHKARWVAEIAKYGGEASATFQVKERLKTEMSQLGVKSPDLARLQKKGSGMFIAMHEQKITKEGGLIQDSIQNATRTKQKIKKAEQGAHALVTKVETNISKYSQNQINRAYQDVDKLNQKAAVLKNVAERNAIATGDSQRLDVDRFLQRTAQAYQNAYSNQFQTIDFAKPMYFRDASDFEIELNVFFRSLISDSEMAMGLNQRTAYYIAWQAGVLKDGRMYGSPQQEGGHALGFHINQNMTFMVFDPNYGEFGCASGNDVIQHFARWFSLYSKDTVISRFGWMKVYQQQIDFLA